jgi:hypothetical protein
MTSLSLVGTRAEADDDIVRLRGTGATLRRWSETIKQTFLISNAVLISRIDNKALKALALFQLVSAHPNAAWGGFLSTYGLAKQKHFINNVLWRGLPCLRTFF